MQTAKADARLFAKTGNTGTVQKRSVFRLLASVGLRRIVRSETTVKSMLVSRGVIRTRAVKAMKAVIHLLKNVKTTVPIIRVQIRNIRHAITITKLLTCANASPLLAVADINVKSIII